jgi:hypothetical protein
MLSEDSVVFHVSSLPQAAARDIVMQDVACVIVKEFLVDYGVNDVVSLSFIHILVPFHFFKDKFFTLALCKLPYLLF